jgi:formiminotetrahydrofolate cyclodeaminase
MGGSVSEGAGPGDLLGLPVRAFVAATAARQPTPGGGSVAALCGALAAALAGMALRYTAGKKAFAAYEGELQAAIGKLETAGKLLEELIAEDVAAYEALSGMLKLPQEARLAHPEYAAVVVAAIRAPETAGAIAANLLELCAGLLEKTNKLLVSDLGIAAVYAHGTVHASELNVRVNLPLLPNGEEAAAVKKRMYEMAVKADKTYEGIRNHLLRVL